MARNSPDNPLLGGVAHRAGVGLFLRSTPLKSPLVQGGTPFSSLEVPQSGMDGSLEKEDP